jgi:hypothetical protein
VEWGVTSVSINRDVIGKTRQIIAKAESELAGASEGAAAADAVATSN